jgi:signal transduction histidine kinase
MIFGVLALVSLSLWLLGLMLMRQNAAFLAAERGARGRVIARSFQKDLVALLGDRPAPFPPAGSRRVELESLLWSLTDTPEVEEVLLRAADGSTLSRQPAPPDRGGPSPREAGLEFSYDVQLAGTHVADLVVRFSGRSLRQQVAYTHLQVLVQLGITTLILVLFLHLLVSLSVVRPIRQLVAATERIAAGDLDRPLELPARADEIGDLGQSFGAMLLRLRESRELNRRQLASLEQAHAELLAKEQELVRAEKMAAVGRVAAGVAHEVGNPLGAVTGYLAMLRGSQLPAEEARESLERIDREVARINRIMVDLLEYARPPRLDWTEIDLNALVRDLRTHLAAQADFARVSLELQQGEDLPAVCGDYHRTRQMLLNLAANAAQAMPAGGTVTLRTFRPGRAGFVAAVSVADDGPGIPGPVREHLFEPFTTAGKGGRGTGLGLAICRQTADALGAAIDVESAAGGTTFTVLFPPAGPARAGTMPPCPSAGS